MNSNVKKYLIYLRYSLPVFALLVIFVMLFIPTYRFIFSGKAGELISGSTLIANSWEQSRNVLFGAAEQVDLDVTFSKILFTLIIVFSILFLLSLAISIWAAIVAFRCFLSNDEEGAENSRRIFCVFVPNRIVLTVLSSLGAVIVCLPYLMKPLYAYIYSESVSLVLEAPDALIVGGVLLLCTVVLSIVCAPMERAFGADIFPKNKKSDDFFDDNDDEENDQGSNDEDIDCEAKERIRRLFDGDKDK